MVGRVLEVGLQCEGDKEYIRAFQLQVGLLRKMVAGLS